MLPATFVRYKVYPTTPYYTRILALVAELFHLKKVRASVPSPSPPQPSAAPSACPPSGGALEASDNPIPSDQEPFDLKSSPDVSAADGITPEAALAELRRLRHADPAEMGIHTPTPIAPFTDVDPVTGKAVGPAKKGFFSKKKA
ncbi:hypothetical protein CcaverHIS631_0702300 [Cutaneotrichosporon cavernicola]|nr:hypothetical protein CcaverHIS631_0702300 [Cutaneotrichosporon cavernicola]